MTRVSNRSLIIAVAVLAAAFAVLLFFMLDFGESAGPEDGVTFSQLVDNPERFAGREVTISGEIEEFGEFTLADADIALAIGGDTDDEILVYPQRGVTLPNGLHEDAVLQVRGTVRPPRTADAEPGDLVAEARARAERDAEAVIEATDVTVPGGDLNDEPGIPAQRRARVEQLLADPRAWDDLPILTVGTAHRIGPLGFVLAGDEGAIYVGAPYSDLSSLEEGQRVQVRAELERISQFRANTILEALAGIPQTEANAPEDVDLDQVPTQEGRPFLVLRTFSTDPTYGVGTPDLPGADS